MDYQYTPAPPTSNDPYGPPAPPNPQTKPINWAGVQDFQPGLYVVYFKGQNAAASTQLKRIAEAQNLFANAIWDAALNSIAAGYNATHRHKIRFQGMRVQRLGETAKWIPRRGWDKQRQALFVAFEVR